MSFYETVQVYIVSLVLFMLFDAVWLGKVAPKLYRRYIGHLMAKKPNFGVAAIFYPLFIVGLLVFVLVPALNSGDFGYAAGYGALFGLFTYATFDLTSQAVFKNWPTTITLIDMVWGVVISLATSVAAYGIASHLIL